MKLFARLFGGLLMFVCHGSDRLVINGYLSGLSRPEQVVYFFREVVGVPVISKESVATDDRLLALGRGLRPQPPDPHRVG